MAPITLESQPQPFARLKVITRVINDEGGNMTAKDFSTSVFAPIGLRLVDFQGNESGIIVNLTHFDNPTFIVHQPGHYAYYTRYSSDCVNQQPRPVTRAQYVCTIVNNDIPVNFDMLSFGDSVMWGTGLLHQQKFRTLVENQIKAAYPNVSVTSNFYAHTGAIIGGWSYNIFRWDQVPGQDTQKLKDFLKRQFGAYDWTNATASKDGETAINLGPACLISYPSRCNTAKISFNPDRPDSANINLGLINRPLFVSKLVDGSIMMSLSPDYYKRYHGEIPRGYPTILQMVDEYAGPIAPNRVDLILLDGCINDVGATTRLLDDQISHSILENIIHQSCYDDMKTLLQAVSSKFPNAVIIVTGYFIAISGQTIQNGGANLIRVLTRDLDPNFGVIVSHWDLWNRDHKSDIRRSIQEMDPSGNRIFFADPLFGPENAVLGENALLFGNSGLPPPITDPAAEERRQACESQLEGSFDKIICKYASTAHPTPVGAKKYADEIMRILDSGVLSNIMTHLDQPKVPPS